MDRLGGVTGLTYSLPTMHPHRELLERFYGAFQRRDGAAMADCYGEESSFSDPIYPLLDRDGVGAMWRMLTERGKDLVLRYEIMQADDQSGQVRWTAHYTFSPTKRLVENVVLGRFTFHDGRIARHEDDFDFWRWSRRALGLPGVLLGWTPLLRQKVQVQAADTLRRYRDASTR
jgi:hypothetical protein